MPFGQELVFKPRDVLDADYRFDQIQELSRSDTLTPVKIRVQGQHQDFGSRMPITAVYHMDDVPAAQKKIPALQQGIYRHGLCFYDAEQEHLLAQARYQLKRDQRKLSELQSQQLRLHQVDQQLVGDLSRKIQNSRQELSRQEEQLYQSLVTQAERFARVALEAETCQSITFTGGSTVIHMVSF